MKSIYKYIFQTAVYIQDVDLFYLIIIIHAWTLYMLVGPLYINRNAYIITSDNALTTIIKRVGCVLIA